MNWQKRFDGFQFDEQGIVEEEVGAEARFEVQTAIGNRNRYLGFCRNATGSKFMEEALLVDTLKQARTKFTVDSDGRINGG